MHGGNEVITPDRRRGVQQYKIEIHGIYDKIKHVERFVVGDRALLGGV